MSDYDDIKNIDSNNFDQLRNNSNQINTFTQNNLIESSFDGHLVTTNQLLNSQRPRSLNKIEIVPAVVYGPLPFS